MHGPLRHIALTVEQTDSGGFRWLLLESAGGNLFVLQRAPYGASTYLRALQAGFEHLALLSASGLREVALPATPEPYPMLEVAEAEHAR